MKNKILLSLKFKVRKKSTILNMLLITIALIILLISNTYSDSALKFWQNDVYELDVVKTLYVSTGDPKSNNITKENLKKIEHVVLVTKFNSYVDNIYSKDLENAKLDGYVSLHVANNESLPKIVAGTNFPDEEGNYLICNKNLYPSLDDDLTKVHKKYSFNTIKNLNKSITFEYNDAIYRHKKYTETFKIVGAFESNIMDEANICYTQEKQMDKIEENMYKNELDIDGTPLMDNESSFYVEVDDLKNKEQVQNDITKLGYSYSDVALISMDDVNEIQKSCRRTSVIVIIFTLIITIVINVKTFNEDSNNYKLLYFLGYERKDLYIFSIISNILELIFSIIVGIIIYFIMYIIYRILIFNYPFILNSWPLCFSYKSLIIILILSLTIITLSSFINTFRLERKLHKI